MTKDFGFKITRAGKGIGSTDLEDYIFWSKYLALAELDTESFSITMEEGTYGGSATFNLDYKFAPFCLVFIEDTTHYFLSTPTLVPWSEGGFVHPGDPMWEWDDRYSMGIGGSLEKDSNDLWQAEFTWYSYSYTPFMPGDNPIQMDVTYDLKIYLYNLELGREIGAEE